VCTVITHPAVPIALSVLLPRDTASSSLVIAASVCSIIPDVDVIGFGLGIRYGDMFGHRAFTHSLTFAVALGALATVTLFQHSHGSPLVIFLYLFLSTLSHPLLDALTNGGLGVGFFAPFSNKRYFFPYRPIEVSPIGISSFFSYRGFEVLLSELRWVWLPSSIFFAIGHLLKRLHSVV
jgi:inner membrane protein